VSDEKNAATRSVSQPKSRIYIAATLPDAPKIKDVTVHGPRGEEIFAPQ